MQDTSLDTNVSTSLPHSKVGIAALATSLLGILVFCIGLAIAFSIGFSGRGVVDQSSTNFRLATFIMCGSLVINVIAMGLGIGSLFQARQNKTFGIIGLVLSVIVLCVYGILAVIGLTMT
jgi:hypothetical protein